MYLCVALQKPASWQTLIYTSKTPTTYSHWARQKGIQIREVIKKITVKPQGLTLDTGSGEFPFPNIDFGPIHSAPHRGCGQIIPQFC